MKIISDTLKVDIPADLKLLFDEQIDFFQKVSQTKSEPRNTINTYEQLFLAKLNYAKLIKSHHIQSCLATESIGPHLVEMPCQGQFKFNYQRVDSQILDYDLSSFYSLDKHFNVTNFFWTSTCQGAISSIFLAMQRHYGKIEFVLPFGAYWESLGFISMFEFQINAAPITPNFLLYIDSSTAPPGWFKKIQPMLHEASWIVVDTTCWELDAEDFSCLMNYLKDKKLAQLSLFEAIKSLTV